MCVLIYIPPFVALPSADVLRDCWEANPHGGGVAWTIDGEVRWRKGFTKLRHVRRFLSRANIPQSSHVIIHFRIATHGEVSPAMTHPFPLRMPDALTALEGSASSVLAHNGILGGVGHDERLSDTALYVRDIHGDADLYRLTGHSGVLSLLHQFTRGSRVVELTPFGPLFVGDAWHESNGAFYSNMNWKPSQAVQWYTRPWAHKGSRAVDVREPEPLPVSELWGDPRDSVGPEGWYGERCYYCDGPINRDDWEAGVCGQCRESLLIQ